MKTKRRRGDTEPAIPVATEDDHDEVREFTVQRFVFETPLYEELYIENEKKLFRMVKIGSSRVDGHCLYCKKNSVFFSNFEIKGESVSIRHSITGYHFLKFTCARCHLQNIIVCVLISAETTDFTTQMKKIKIRKIGQWPTHADLANKELDKYLKVLSTEDRGEIARANGLAAHGVNIGAFVYLRRVFERLIYRAFERSALEMNRDDFSKLRMPEKMDTVKEQLPKFVREHKNIYRILSKGIHELNESECGKYYEILKQSIILILDREKEIALREESEEKLGKMLKGISE